MCIAAPKRRRWFLRYFLIIAFTPLFVTIGGCDLFKANTARPPRNPYGVLSLSEFNRRASLSGVPLFWINDFNQNKTLDARELAVLWRMDSRVRKWVVDGEFTPEFNAIYAQLKAPLKLSSAQERQILNDLEDAVATLVHTDFALATPDERAFVRKAEDLAKAVEKLHMRQLGSARYLEQLRGLEGVRRALFFRNQSPWCAGQDSNDNQGCGAFEEVPPHIYGIYPRELQAQKDFCSVLQQQPNAKELLDRFHTVERRNGQFVAVPYSVAFRDEMKTVARELLAMADILEKPSDAALRDYLLAAAQAFETNDWEKADEAWLEVLDSSSSWYVRVATDMTVLTPCGHKGMVYLSFGRTDRKTKTWRRKLALIQDKLEQRVAVLAGKPYRARKVTLTAPTLVNIVLNAGHTRLPKGAFIGRSLPSHGRLAREGRQRTITFVNMTHNAYGAVQANDAVESYICSDSIDNFRFSHEARIMSVMLEGAARILGPTDSYEVRGRTPIEIFGGVQSLILRELKAKASALNFIEWLKSKDLIEPKFAREVLSSNVQAVARYLKLSVNASSSQFGTYARVGTIELAMLLEYGALIWHEERLAANRKDVGCLSLQFDTYPQAVEAYAKKIVSILAQGDSKAAQQLEIDYIDNGPRALMAIIAERVSRQASSHFVYSIRTDRQNL